MVWGIGKVADSDFIQGNDSTPTNTDSNGWSSVGWSQFLVGVEGENYLRAPAIDPEERTVAAVSQDGIVTFWSVDFGDVEQVREVPDLRLRPTDLAALSSDGHFLAVASGTGRASGLTVYDLTGEEDYLLLDQQGPLRDLAFAPYGEFLVTVTTDHRIRVWDPTTGDPLGPEVQAAEGPWAISDDATRLVYLDAEGRLHSCDPADPRSSDQSDIDFPNHPLTLALTADGAALVGLVREEYDDGWVNFPILYRNLNRETDPPTEVNFLSEDPAAMIIDPDGELVAGADIDGPVNMDQLSYPDADTVFLFLPWEVDDEVTLTSLRFAPDSSYLVGQLSDGRFALWFSPE